MKKYIIWLITVCFCTALIAQNKAPLNTIINNKLLEEDFPSYQLLENDPVNQISDINRVFRNADIFAINESGRSQLLNDRPENLEFQLTTNQGDLILQLTRYQVVTDDFTAVTNEQPDTPIDYEPGLYYRGIVNGNPNSSAAISIFKDEIIGMVFPRGEEVYTIGKVKNNGDKHVGYYEKDLIPTHDFNCDTDDRLISSSEIENLKENFGNNSSAQMANCVRVFLELEYNLVTEKGGSAGAINFMTGLWNVVALLYQNESITTTVSQMYVWTTPDSYPTNSTLAALQSFRATRTSFNGDLAHLVSRGAPAGGGIAYVNALCTSNKYAYSYIYSSYNNYPTYSWSVNVLTHEMGHNLGSRHTHDCVWNGNNTAIDGCGPTAGYAGDPGGCGTGPLPAQGRGTIMSYCHLVSSVGIGLTYGFGPQPGNLIRSRVASASCLQACETECPANRTLSGTVSNTLNEEVSNNITSTQTLTASANVEYQAGNLILLSPGFISTTGSDLRAHIADCSSSLVGDPVAQTSQYDSYPEQVQARKIGNLPAEVDLRCMPNPFSSSTVIEYRLTEEVPVELYVLNVNGRVLKSFNLGGQPSGVHRFDFTPEGMLPGIYFLKMRSGDTVSTTKIILSR